MMDEVDEVNNEQDDETPPETGTGESVEVEKPVEVDESVDVEEPVEAGEGPEVEEAPEAAEAAEAVVPEAVEGELDETEEDETSVPEPAASVGELVRDIEALLFVSPEPVTLEVLAEVTEVTGEDLAHAVEAVREKYSDPAGGIAFAEVAGGYTFRSSDAARPAVERFCARPIDYSLSAAAMETLAIIAYLQPITRPEVARIRGVGADTVVANLMDKGLVEEAGRHQQSGAVKYRTTPAFEKLFGLSGMGELPSLDGFEATARDVEELREKLYTAAEKRSSGTPY